jgi:hypothetical protein
MKLGYKFCRNALIKIILLGIAGAFFLWVYFTRGKGKDDPAIVFIYIGFVILVWIAFVTVLAVATIRLGRVELGGSGTMNVEPGGPANGSRRFRSETDRAAGSGR